MMNLTIPAHNAERVMSAIQRRRQLLSMYTREMPDNYEEELVDMDRIIAAAVSVAVMRSMKDGEKYAA
ncbi:MAG: hypothetical protein V7700_08410 [Halioglobus sp.]